MKSSCFPAMAVAVFLALTLPETYASEDTCEDNPNWRFKGNEEHDCEWIAAKESRKEKKCRKNAVQRNCRMSCDLCDVGFLFCPGKLNSRKFDRDCDDYEPGLECGYDHVWTGCNSGDMACTPTKVYSCSAQEADGSTMNWNFEDIDDENCEPYEDGSLYGTPCHPTDCPTVEPVEGDSCAWYEGENRCGYDHQWLGCDYNDLTCRSTREYECDRANLTWTLDIVRNGPDCPFRPDPGLPQGESCNTEDPQPTPPLDGSYQCPEEAPTTDTCSETGRTPDEGCDYNYVVMGCTPETIRCDAVENYRCDYDGGPWLVLMHSIEDCGVDGVTTGVSCDPENFDPTEYFEEEEFVCPSIPPRLDSPCDEEEVPYEGCEYYFVVTGCDYDSLSCSSTYVSTCEDRGADVESFYTWQAIIVDPFPCYQLDGVPEDWPDGRGCDPENFNKDELLESLSPDDSNDERPSDDSIDGTPPRDPPKEYECPADVPIQGDDCTDDTYDPDGCEYDHLVMGCTYDELVCHAATIASCDNDRPPVVITDENGDQYVQRFLVWNVATSGMEEGCPLAEDGWPAGESCDPETFDKTDYLDRLGGDSGLVCPEEVPEFGEICDGLGTCEYEHKVYGCTTEELFCAPATWADCIPADIPVKDGEDYGTEPGFRFIIASSAYMECDDVPEDWPEGQECDPETFDPRALLAENESLLQLRR